MRAFLSINFPSDLQRQIAKVQSNLKSAVKGSFVRPENVHITLKFLGELSDTDITNWARRIKLITFRPFKTSLKGLSSFPNEKNARVIFMETQDGRKEIEEIEKQLSHDKEFKPHATLVRVKYKDAETMKDLFEKYRNEDFGSFTCEKISLMKSTLTSDGPIYEEINIK